MDSLFENSFEKLQPVQAYLKHENNVTYGELLRR